MVFRASRIVITTSATPRVSVDCELGGGGPSPLTASEPDAIAAECPLRVLAVIVGTTDKNAGFPA
jgi:hypothetical protein